MLFRSNGKSGSLVFVTVTHDIYANEVFVLSEEQDIVYREAGAPGVKAPALPVLGHEPEWSHKIMADPVLLFRFSALTFNSHRIHYDRDYAVNEEYYPDLVVHGPLLAIFVMDQVRQRYPQATVESFSFRMVGPTFVNTKIVINGSQNGKDLFLRVVNAEGGLSLKATVKFKLEENGH